MNVKSLNLKALTGKPFADMWVHTRFLQVEGTKMSKSKGNFFTVRDLTNPESKGGKDLNPFAVRLALISGQYRKPYNFTFKTLMDCVQNVERFLAVQKLAEEGIENGSDGPDEFGEALDSSYERALHAMLDDLNTPLAIAAAVEGSKLVAKQESLSKASAKKVQSWLDNMNALLGLFKYDNGYEPAGGASNEEAALASRVEQLLEDRQAARNARTMQELMKSAMSWIPWASSSRIHPLAQPGKRR